MNKLILIFASLFAAQTCFAEKLVTVGSKNFTENILLAEMVSLILESKGLMVQRKFSLGGTQVAFDALRTGDIDVYPEYTGTGHAVILGLSGSTDPEEIYRVVQHQFKDRFDLTWSLPIGFENSYALAVRGDDPRFLKLSKVSDLGALPKHTFGGPHEFMERPDGFDKFISAYGLKFRPENVFSIDQGLLYSALKENRLDMIMANSTDGRLLSFGLKMLEDDRKVFPPYMSCLLVRNDTLSKVSELKETLALMANLISREEMVELNDRVDRLKRDPKTVAHNFLLAKGRITGTRIEPFGQSGFFQFAYKKRNYLYKLFVEHLRLSLGAILVGLIVSLPIGIVLTRRPTLGRFVFPIINVIQTIPSIALLGFLVPLMGIGSSPALLALFLYSLLPLIRNTYIGIVGVDKDLIEASRGIGLTNWQILHRVEIPLALPVILAGIRTATVIVIGTTTLAALVGAGGFGDPIFRGVATINSNLILLGALPAALLAIMVDRLIGLLEHLVVSKGIKLRNM